MPEFSDEVRLSSLAAAGWSDVCDRIVAGLCHDLNGRVTSLAGMVQLLRLEEDSGSLIPFLEEEVGRLERTVALLRSTAGEPLESPEPLHLPEFVPELVQLFDRHRHLEVLETGTTFGDGLLPVRARFTYLGRAILILLSIAGREAMIRERRLALEVDLDGETGRVRVTARAGEVLRDPSERPDPAGRAAGMPRVAELLGGVWSERVDDDGASWSLELPAMGRGG